MNQENGGLNFLKPGLAFIGFKLTGTALWESWLKKEIPGKECLRVRYKRKIVVLFCPSQNVILWVEQIQLFTFWKMKKMFPFEILL